MTTGAGTGVETGTVFAQTGNSSMRDLPRPEDVQSPVLKRKCVYVMRY